MSHILVEGKLNFRSPRDTAFLRWQALTRSENPIASSWNGSSGRQTFAGDTSTEQCALCPGKFFQKRERKLTGEHPCDDPSSWYGFNSRRLLPVRTLAEGWRYTLCPGRLLCTSVEWSARHWDERHGPELVQSRSRSQRRW